MYWVDKRHNPVDSRFIDLVDLGSKVTGVAGKWQQEQINQLTRARRPGAGALSLSLSLSLSPSLPLTCMHGKPGRSLGSSAQHEANRVLNVESQANCMRGR